MATLSRIVQKLSSKQREVAIEGGAQLDATGGPQPDPRGNGATSEGSEERRLAGTVLTQHDIVTAARYSHRAVAKERPAIGSPNGLLSQINDRIRRRLSESASPCRGDADRSKAHSLRALSTP